jgi:hypothetical protein
VESVGIRRLVATRTAAKDRGDLPNALHKKTRYSGNLYLRTGERKLREQMTCAQGEAPLRSAILRSVRWVMVKRMGASRDGDSSIKKRPFACGNNELISNVKGSRHSKGDGKKNSEREREREREREFIIAKVLLGRKQATLPEEVSRGAVLKVKGGYLGNATENETSFTKGKITPTKCISSIRGERSVQVIPIPNGERF